MQKNKSVGLFRPGSLTKRSESDIKAYAKSATARKASARLREHMRLHGPEPSEEDLAENPVLTDEELRRMYRPIKTPVTVRLDADVLAWLRSKGGAYQTHMNELLREMMKRELRARR